ncbi:MAG: hypothetical protein NC413_00680 [Muribaculum sp.]|nr:hypothetical protein [Muribaculum sp.]
MLISRQPFDASTLVLFRKRITADMLNKANEYLLAHKDDEQPGPPYSGDGTQEKGMPKEEGADAVMVWGVS